MAEHVDRPRRADRRRGSWRGLDLARGRLWAAVLALALVPAATGILVTTAMANEPDPTIAVERTRRTSSGAADLLLREHRIEARLTALAADPALMRLAGGISSGSARLLAEQALATLQGTDGPIVSGACITRVSDGRMTLLGDGTTPASAAACADSDLLAHVQGLTPGSVSRAHTMGPSRTGRLTIASPLGAGDEVVAVLSAQVDLAELFARTPSASSAAPTALLVDRRSADVVAGASTPAEGAGSPESLRPGEVDMYVRGILTNHRPSIEGLAAGGWITTLASLWPTVQGSELGLIHVWPKPVAGPSLGMILALVGLLAVALAAGIAFMRHLIRPFHELEESQAQLATLYREAREDSLHDGLTGMGNHRSFREELGRQIELFERDGAPFSLMLIDLDNLKVVNDREGHAEGDRLLVGLSTAMREAFRATDRLFRTGGDEFAVLLPDTEPQVALQVASRLRLYCSRPPSGQRPIQFSGGISAVPHFTREANQLYRQADVALYWAKRHGRGFVELFDPDRDEVPGEGGPLGLDNAIYEVIRARAFSPVYQAIVDLRTGAVLGFEGLIRPHPDGPFPDPHRLFAAAAATGRTVELDLASLEVVTAGASGISSDHLVSVNLSSKTLEVTDFDAGWLLNTLLRHGISPSRVIVELTERDPISDVKRLQRNIRHLAEYGLRIAADDVGAGNAGLRLLSQVPFDIVKIDLSLVQEAARNTASWAVLRSLRDFALRQDAIVIGEGVETPEQLRALRQLDIPIGQGYLLGLPQPRPDISSVDLANLSAPRTNAPSGPPVPEPAGPRPPAPTPRVRPPALAGLQTRPVPVSRAQG